ncbi:MAG: signal peptidase I [Nitrosarchaeum sp.]|nr:signal peptidase I [Nitrosarchaeum sp.]
MAKRSISKGIIKDILIVGIGVLVIWISLQIVFGTQNPFYVVASGSMVPKLLVYDVLIVQGHEPFNEIEVGDIIVFNRPSDHNRVIVHRVASILDDDPRTLRTKGDANPASIPGTDFPITEKEYIGKVAYVIPQVGYVTQVLKPPINYIIIAIVVGIMIVKQMTSKKKEKESTLEDPFHKEEQKEFSVKTKSDKLKEDLEETEKKTDRENREKTDSEEKPKKNEKQKD